ncbi:MAG: DUF5666 domain-containing protein [Planctomycetota bacterium]|jgi:predicted RNA-binding protein
MRNALLVGLTLFLLLCPLMTAKTPDSSDVGKKTVCIKGEITKIDPDKKQIIVKGEKYDHIVQVTKKTLIKDKSGKITFDDLKVGMKVLAKGFYKEKILYAEYIGVGITGSSASIKGEITKIDPDKKQIVVKGEKYDHIVQVTKKTLIKDKTGKITFDDLKVEMEVFVKGTFKEKILYASYIEVISSPSLGEKIEDFIIRKL